MAKCFENISSIVVKSLQIFSILLHPVADSPIEPWIWLNLCIRSSNTYQLYPCNRCVRVFSTDHRPAIYFIRIVGNNTHPVNLNIASHPHCRYRHTVIVIITTMRFFHTSSDIPLSGIFFFFKLYQSSVSLLRIRSRLQIETHSRRYRIFDY